MQEEENEYRKRPDSGIWEERKEGYSEKPTIVFRRATGGRLSQRLWRE